MKELIIAFSHMARRIFIDDPEKADTAYAAMKTALEEHREYGNDQRRTIEIDVGCSGIETILVGAVASVSLMDLSGGEDAMVKRAVWEKRMEAKIASALQPAAE